MNEEEYQQIKHKIETLDNYNIYALGLSGVGKTHFIPCMYHYLILPPGKLGFVIVSPDTYQQEKLDQASQRLEEERNWLPPTMGGDPTTWTFTCRVPQKGRFVDVFQFTYIDYHGGTLFDPPGDAGAEKKKRELRKKIQEEADVLFGFIDGEIMLSIISEDISKEDKEAYEEKLRNMLEFMQNVNKPVHFVITKWDRLSRANISLPKILPQVQMYLRKIPFFQNFVETQRQTGAVVRLIPVSAVGMNFADPQSNIIRSNRDIHLAPINIEIPLLYAIPDILLGQMKQLNLIANGMTDQSALLRILRPIPNLLTPIISHIFATYAPHLPLSSSFKPALPVVLGDIEREIDEGINRNQARPDINYHRLKEVIHNKRRVFRYTIKKFLSLTREFERNFRGSRL